MIFTGDNLESASIAALHVESDGGVLESLPKRALLQISEVGQSERRSVNHTCRRPTSFDKGDVYREFSTSFQKLLRTIERIDEPKAFVCFAQRRHRVMRFFRDDRYTGN